MVSAVEEGAVLDDGEDNSSSSEDDNEDGEELQETTQPPQAMLSPMAAKLVRCHRLPYEKEGPWPRFCSWYKPGEQGVVDKRNVMCHSTTFR